MEKQQIAVTVPDDLCPQAEIDRIRQRLRQLASERAGLRLRLAELMSNNLRLAETEPSRPVLTMDAADHEKVALFRALFAGRTEVFPKRWENTRNDRNGYAPACNNEWKPNLCGKPRIKCSMCPNQAFIPVSDEAVIGHLRGHHTMGVYPLMPDDTCNFLAVDFDKATWQDDAGAFLDACKVKQVSAALERSRSGDGGHVWIFFSVPVPAVLARKLGSTLLTEAMECHPDMGFESYDRLFPSQDALPTGGFGNLIALPLQHGPRQNDNSVFLDRHFDAHADQWEFLSSIDRLSLTEVTRMVQNAEQQGRIVGLRLPVNEEDDTPWTAPPSRRRPLPDIRGCLPESIEAVSGDQIYLSRDGLPPDLVNRLIRLAAFQNPAFYRAQAMRRSVFTISRIISCAELLSHHIALPRGCWDDLEQLCKEVGVSLHSRDECNPGSPVKTTFLGKLTMDQKAAADALLSHETGVLSATTGFGKNGGGRIGYRRPQNQHACTRSPTATSGPMDCQARFLP